ncbi:MAG: Zn-ribbon domain-containing OB-fold protein [Candidatus Binatia bacterium]
MNQITKWHGEIPIQSLYTAGVGGQIFFTALKNRGELLGTRCAPCGQVYLPARLFCERCFAELAEQVSVKLEGIIKSFTIVYVNRDNEQLPQPLALALVQLDGATTFFLHKLLNVSDASQITIGDRARIVLKPEAERRGSILDIEGFRVLNNSGS